MSARPRTSAAGPAAISSKPPQTECRTADWVNEIADADFILCDSEVDALLMESRLIKDIQPKYNKDSKTTRPFRICKSRPARIFPASKSPARRRDKGVRLFGPFANAGALRGAMQVLQRIFKFRTCSLDIDDGDERWRWFRPCLLPASSNAPPPATSASARKNTAKTSTG